MRQGLEQADDIGAHDLLCISGASPACVGEPVQQSLRVGMT
jgi:hypothetical protein